MVGQIFSLQFNCKKKDKFLSEQSMAAFPNTQIKLVDTTCARSSTEEARKKMPALWIN